ncbi:MAG: hypothetical protein M3393_00795 [Actinomycetota bacterium]|jgi:hypothetical protein|nr:hypothetical protein [Actinomycetota bacterium]
MSLTPLVTAAAEVHSEPVVHPYVVGAVTLLLLLAMMAGLLMFGKGRDHS